MIRGRASKAPPWSSEEIAILIDVFPRGGIDEATDALPDRSWRALIAMASKLGLRSPNLGTARSAELAGDALEEAILQREELGWSFERIGRAHGVCETAAQNAVLIALCPRKGFRPAEREAKGKLLPEGVERLREMLRQGRKGVEISLELGVSVARIALERRTMNAQLAADGLPPLPAPGAGQRYSGAKIAHDVYDQVDQLFMQGYGAPRIAELTMVSKVQLGRRRNKLVKRLAREGRSLPGCDLDGHRHSYKDSLASVTAEQCAVVRAELLKGTSAARAATIAVIGSSFAYRIREELVAELKAAGRSLPRARPVQAGALGDPARNWLPKGKRNLILFRRHLKECAGDLVEAKRRTISELQARLAKATAPQPKRPLTFEEQLARVASGQARIIEKVPFHRPGYAGTLGGVSAGIGL